MADSSIEWTDKVWNPVAGCSVLSPGCTNCYAMRMAARIARMGGKAAAKYAGTTQASKAGPVWTGGITFDYEALLAPLRWKKPARIFVNSMSDLFHESVTDDLIDQVFAVMALCRHHTFQVLTKRAARMRAYFETPHPAQNVTAWQARVSAAIDAIVPMRTPASVDAKSAVVHHAPLPNVWLGVSVEDQRRADERIPELLATPAAVRWVSAEPLLGPLDLYNGDADPRLGGHKATATYLGQWWPPRSGSNTPPVQGVGWVVAGGESGPHARPCHPDWLRSLRDQCGAAEVPFFFKQWGRWRPMVDSDTRRDWMIVHRDGTTDVPDDRSPDESAGESAMLPVGKHGAGATLDGRAHREYPA